MGRGVDRVGESADTVICTAQLGDHLCRRLSAYTVYSLTATIPMLSAGNDRDIPLVEQIVQDFARKISSRQLTPGARLPSVRQLAQRMGVSVFTVVTAYDRLVAAGAIQSRRGSGFFVLGNQSEVRPLARIPEREMPVSPVDLLRQAINHEIYDVAPGAGYLPATWVSDSIPPAVWAKAVRKHGESGQPAPPEGTPELREQIANRLKQSGIEVSASDVVSTYGASHAFDLVCKSYLRAGDVVIVEDPGYFMLHAQLRHHGLNIVAVRRLSDGPDVEQLEALAKKHEPRAFFTQTLLHNPMGGSTSSRKCHRILSLAERFGFKIVEDDIYGELAVDNSPRLAQLDSGGHVIYVSSYSKLLSAGLRLGYVILPPELKATFVHNKLVSVLVGSAIVETAVAEALATGRFRHHVDRLREKLGKSRAQASRALSEAGVSLVNRHTEGVFLWGKLPDDTDMGDVLAQAHQQRILLAPGALFSPAGGPSSFLRFSAPYSLDPRLLEFLRLVISRGNRSPLRLVSQGG